MREFDAFKDQLPDIDPAETAEWIQSLDDIIETNPGRAAFLLRVEGGLSFREAAEVLGTTEETARWRVFKARQKLLSVLAPELDRETS